jgi:hypothetical protein
MASARYARREGMRIVIPDDYQDAVRHLACFETLAGHQVTVYHDHTEDVETLATRFQEADALVLIRVGVFLDVPGRPPRGL